MTTYHWIDVLLAAGLTARLTRFIVADDLGAWWIQSPLLRIIENHASSPAQRRKWIRYWEGLQCPYCAGFWVAGAVLLSLWAVGGPGDAAEPWRWFAGWWTLNYVTAHIGARLGDTAHD